MSGPDPAGLDFYRTLTGVSFTLLGLWFTVINLAHGEWRGRLRHRFTLHVGLHFFLPGMIGMASQLSEGGADGGLFWRAAMVLAGIIGLVESLTLRRPPDAGPPPPGWWLRRVDPVLYLAVLVVGVLPPGLTTFAPLQLAGAVTGLLFLVGLCVAWLAFAESGAARDGEDAPPDTEPVPVPVPPERGDTGPWPDCRFSYLCARSPANAPAVRCATCPAAAPSTPAGHP